MPRKYHKKPKNPPIMVDATIMFAAACAAWRINGKYVGNSYQHMDKNLEFNYEIMKRLIFRKNNEILTEDYNMAQEVMEYWRCQIGEILSETSSEFISKLIHCAISKEIGSDQIAAIAMSILIMKNKISRDLANKKEEQYIYQSKPVGKIGDKITINIKIINPFYSDRYGVFRYTGVSDGNLFVFWNSSTYLENNEYTISARIKKHENNMTYLNYIKDIKN